MARVFAGFTPEQLGKIDPSLQGLQSDEQQKIIAANPALAARVGKMSEMAQQRVGMAQGGYAKKGYAEGGAAVGTDLNSAQSNYADSLQKLQDARNAQAADPTNEDLLKAVKDAEASSNLAQEQLGTAETQYKITEMPTSAELLSGGLNDPASMVTSTDVKTIDVKDEQLIDESTGQLTGPAPTATVTEAASSTPVAEPEKKEAVKYEPLPATAGVEDVLSRLEAATGKPSEEALAEAQAMNPQDLAQLGLNAQQIEAAVRVEAPQERTIQEGELVSGPTVDMGRVEKEIDYTAVTGSPSTEATVQGQLTGLMEQFEGGATPVWAAGAMREAAAQMAARGLSASSIAGQAIVQATMESAINIATTDAATFSRFEERNLSNKQQMAVLAAEQRASFLNLEFDQAFQTKVANAAKITEIAKGNYDTSVQIALENSRNAQSVDLANLNAVNAKVLADASAMSQLDITNLNNRQQAQVVNAKSFLDMDMANLSNEQQTAIFSTQSIINSLLSDSAAENASRQFNASSEMQTDQFFANLASTISMFNTEQTDKINMFNSGEANVLEKFNKELLNMREQFNASNSLIIDQANTNWYKTIATTDTAAINEANRLDAAAENGMTNLAFNAYMQEVRDIMSFSWQTENNDADRATQLAIAKISSNDAKSAAAASKSVGFWGALGSVAAAILRR